MNEVIQYFKAKEKLSQPIILEEAKKKFKDKQVKQILNKLIGEGLIYEPRRGIYRWLGE